MGRQRHHEDDEPEFDYEEPEEDIEDEEEEETLEELDVDENGHVIEGRRNKRRSRDDEFEEDFDYEERNPVAYGFQEERLYEEE